MLCRLNENIIGKGKKMVQLLSKEFESFLLLIKELIKTITIYV